MGDHRTDVHLHHDGGGMEKTKNHQRKFTCTTASCGIAGVSMKWHILISGDSQTHAHRHAVSKMFST